MEYLFRCATKEDIDAVFSLYEKRVQWMDAKGIHQWNGTDYLVIYPKSYYQEQQACSALYVLLDDIDSIVGAVVLLQNDERWADRANDSSLYIHNLVTDPDVMGCGKKLLSEVEKLAQLHGKRYVRLDCATDSVFLNGYYSSAGYEIAGQCKDGLYIGNRREKKL